MSVKDTHTTDSELLHIFVFLWFSHVVWPFSLAVTCLQCLCSVMTEWKKQHNLHILALLFIYLAFCGGNYIIKNAKCSEQYR